VMYRWQRDAREGAKAESSLSKHSADG
jgi:hypothetical protein